MNQHFDCVIVGGGSAGASLALALGQCHYQVLLIEKNAAKSAQPDNQARTVGLSYASARIYGALNIWESLRARAVPIEQVTVSVQGQYGTCRLHHAKLNVPALGYVVGLTELEHALYKKLETIPNVVIARTAQVTHIEPLVDYWQGEYFLNEGTKSFTTRLLVAAEGMASPLRQLQGIGVNTTTYEHYAVMANVRLAEQKNIAIERFLTTGAIALLPWQNDMATCVWTATAGEAPALMALSETEFLQACQQQLGYRLGCLQAVYQRTCLPLKMQLATQQHSARFLLIGNAAHNLHPIAAQGLNLSLRDIWQIRHQCQQQPRPQDLGHPDFLQKYINGRKADQQRIIFSTDKIARYMSGGPLPSWLRAMGMTIFDCITPLKRQFALYSMGFS